MPFRSIPCKACCLPLCLRSARRSWRRGSWQAGSASIERLSRRGNRFDSNLDEDDFKFRNLGLTQVWRGVACNAFGRQAEALTREAKAGAFVYNCKRQRLEPSLTIVY